MTVESPARSRSIWSASISQRLDRLRSLGVGPLVEQRRRPPPPVGRRVRVEPARLGQVVGRVGRRHRVVVGPPPRRAAAPGSRRGAPASCGTRSADRRARRAAAPCRPAGCSQPRRSVPRLARTICWANAGGAVDGGDHRRHHVLEPARRELHEARPAASASPASSSSPSPTSCARRPTAAPPVWYGVEPLEELLEHRRVDRPRLDGVGVGAEHLAQPGGAARRRGRTWSYLLLAAIAMSKARNDAGATRSSMTGGPITCSGAITTSTCWPASSGGFGIWSTIASTDTLPGGPSATGVAAAGAVVERDQPVGRCVDAEVPVDRRVDAAEAADAVGDRCAGRGRTAPRGARTAPSPGRSVAPAGNSSVARVRSSAGRPLS